MEIKPSVKYAIEFILIFLSVVLAFIFEDYRSKKEEKKNYITALKSFRHDLYGEFVSVKRGFHLDSDHIPKLLKYDSLLSHIQSSSDPIANLATLKQIHYQSLNNLPPISLWYEKLSDYPFHIQSDQIDYLMNWYISNRQNRQAMYNSCAEIIENFWNANSHIVDLTNIESKLNEPIANSIEFKNTVFQTHEILKAMVSFDEFYCKNFLDSEIKNLDRRLKDHDANISDLESEELYE